MAKLKELIGYDKLNFIDKLRLRYRIRQEEKLESIRQSLEGDDYLGVDEQGILDQLIAEKENRKNNVKALNAGNDKEIIEPPNSSTEWKVDPTTLSNPQEFQQLSDSQIIEMIIGELDFTPPIDSEEKIDYLNQLRNIVSQKYGSKYFDKAYDVFMHEGELTMQISELKEEEQEKIKVEITNNQDLQKKLKHLRYHPKEDEAKYGIGLEYRVVYAQMMEDERMSHVEIVSQEEMAEKKWQKDTKAEQPRFNSVLNMQTNNMDSVYEQIIQLEEYRRKGLFLSEIFGKKFEVYGKYGENVWNAGSKMLDSIHEDRINLTKMSSEEISKYKRDFLTTPTLKDMYKDLRYHPEKREQYVKNGIPDVNKYSAVYDMMLEEERMNNLAKNNRYNEERD